MPLNSTCAMYLKVGYIGLNKQTETKKIHERMGQPVEQHLRITFDDVCLYADDS
jgi:hypothetical protein